MLKVYRMAVVWIAVVVCLAIMPTGIVRAAKQGDYQYTVLADGTAEITQSKTMRFIIAINWKEYISRTDLL